MEAAPAARAVTRSSADPAIAGLMPAQRTARDRRRAPESPERPGRPGAPPGNARGAGNSREKISPGGASIPGVTTAAQPGERARVPPAPSAPARKPVSESRAQQAFISAVAPGAVQAQHRYGVPAAVTIAQAIDESGWGQSELAARDHNLFGIKGTGPAGSVPLPTQEYVNGQPVSTSASFRAYHDVAESIDDHGRLLARSGYYQQAMGDRTHPDRFAAALTGVYATDPNYGANLISLMRRYDLYRYGVSGHGQPGAASRGAEPGSARIPGVPAAPPAPAQPAGSASPSPRPTPTAPAHPASPRPTPTAPASPRPTPTAPASPRPTPTPTAPASPRPTPTPTAPASPRPTPTAPANPASPKPSTPVPALAPSPQPSSAAPAPPASPRPTSTASPRPSPPASAQPSIPGISTQSKSAHRLSPARAHRAGQPVRAALTGTRRYESQIPRPVLNTFVESAKAPLLAGQTTYQDVAARRGISWQLLAACDWMQCEARARRSPVYGERLGAVNGDGTVYVQRSAALGRCADDLVRLSRTVYGLDLTRADLSVPDLANAFAAFRWGGLLKAHDCSAMEFPYSVEGLTDRHVRMRWPRITDPGNGDRPGARFHRRFGAVPIVLSLDYPATV